MGFDTNTPEIDQRLAEKVEKLNKLISKYALPRGGFMGRKKRGPYVPTEDEKIAIDCIANDREIPDDVAKRLLETREERYAKQHEGENNTYIPLYVLKRIFPQIFKD